MATLQKEPYFLQFVDPISVRVYAKNQIGDGPYSDEVLFTPSTDEIGGLMLRFPRIGSPSEDEQSRTNTSVTIDWERVGTEDDKEYWLYMSVGRGTPYEEIFITTDTSFDVQNINKRDIYSFKVQMRTECGLVPVSPEMSIYFGPPTRPPSTSLN